MSVAIRNGSVYVLALGVAVGLATVRAASDDSHPTALDSAQPNGVASMPSGEETFLPEANILIERPVRPFFSCCVPVTPPPHPGEPRFTCVTPTIPSQCVRMSGIPASSCFQCLEVKREDLANTEKEVDTTGDDSPVTEPAGASPVEPTAGSAWNLLVLTLFLASL